MKTIKQILFIALLTLPGFIEAQQQQVVIVPQDNKQQFYGVDTSDPIVGYLNWNIARNAAIGDAVRLKQLSPPDKIIIQQQPAPAQPMGVFAPVAPQAAAPVDYGVFNGLQLK